MGPDTLLDARTCTCCQTSADITDAGRVLVVYRDRSADEIRDIAIVSNDGSGWTAPQAVAADGWRIEGCPVNDPAIDAVGETAVVARFTATNDIPKVKPAFSHDGGTTFEPAIDVGGLATFGRVDTLALQGGLALVSWVAQAQVGEAIIVCVIDPRSGCEAPVVAGISHAGRSVGFSRMTQGKAGVYLAWTHPPTLRAEAAGTQQRYVPSL